MLADDPFYNALIKQCEQQVAARKYELVVGKTSFASGKYGEVFPATCNRWPSEHLCLKIMEAEVIDDRTDHEARAQTQAAHFLNGHVQNVCVPVVLWNFDLGLHGDEHYRAILMRWYQQAVRLEDVIRQARMNGAVLHTKANRYKLVKELIFALIKLTTDGMTYREPTKANILVQHKTADNFEIVLLDWHLSHCRGDSSNAKEEYHHMLQVLKNTVLDVLEDDIPDLQDRLKAAKTLQAILTLVPK